MQKILSLARTLAFKLAHALLFLVMLWGAVVVAFAGAALYVLLSGNVRPGDPMFLGDPAPTTGQALLTTGVGALMIIVSLIASSYLKKVSAGMPSSNALQSDGKLPPNELTPRAND